MENSVVILAGGLGTRLGKLTKNLPKSMISVNQKPFFYHQLNLLESKGVKNIHFCLGHYSDILKKSIMNSIFYNKLNVTFSFDGEKLLGTGGAIKNAFQFITDEFFVMYGDSYLDVDLKMINSFYKMNKKNGDGLMTIFKNNKKYDTSNVVYKNNYVSNYSKKKIVDEMNYIDYGIGILTKEHFLTYDNNPFDLSILYEKLSKKSRLIGYEVKNRFYEVGSIDDIKNLSKYLIKNKL